MNTLLESLTASEIAHRIAHSPLFPPTPKELAIMKEEYEGLGFQVVFSKPLDFEPEPVEIQERKPVVFLCENCGCKIGSDGNCWCGNHFPEELNY